MGYGVFVRPGCGGVKEKVILARYLGAVIPFSAPELKEDESRYLFELHDRIRGSKKNQMCIDSATHGNWTRFVNANCKPNCESMLITVGKRAYLLYVTKLAVAEGKELTVSYGPEYFRDGDTECLCDARGRISRRTSLRRSEFGVSLTYPPPPLGPAQPEECQPHACPSWKEPGE